MPPSNPALNILMLAPLMMARRFVPRSSSRSRSLRARCRTDPHRRCRAHHAVTRRGVDPSHDGDGGRSHHRRGARMLWAMMQLLLLTAGIYVGAHAVGLGSSIFNAQTGSAAAVGRFGRCRGLRSGAGLVQNMPRDRFRIVFICSSSDASHRDPFCPLGGSDCRLGLAAMVASSAIIVESEASVSFPRSPLHPSVLAPRSWVSRSHGLVATVSGERGAYSVEIAHDCSVQSGAVIIAILIGMRWRASSAKSDSGTWNRGVTGRTGRRSS